MIGVRLDETTSGPQASGSSGAPIGKRKDRWMCGWGLTFCPSCASRKPQGKAPSSRWEWEGRQDVEFFFAASDETADVARMPRTVSVFFVCRTENTDARTRVWAGTN